MVRLLPIALLLSCLAPPAPAQKYNGPRPPKPDIPHLLHASNLLELEQAEAEESKQKDTTTYAVPGAASPARTPLAEPIFLLQAEKLIPEKLELYRLEVKNGRRQITFSDRKPKDNPRPLPVSITRLDKDLYRIEAATGLDNGEYSLTPSGSNRVYLFQVY
jgi:hypothetical protein